MPAFDVDKIKRQNPLSQYIGSRVELRQDGKEFKGCCPFHKEKTPSFTVSDDKDFYHCFGCGVHGDLIDFVMEYNRVPFKEACEILGGEREENHDPQQSAPKEPAPDCYDGIELLAWEPDELKPGERYKVWNPKRERFSYYTPSMVFPYRRAGRIMFYVMRVEMPDNKKITPVIGWCRMPDGTKQLSHYPAPDQNRPLYGDHEITKQVVIVEGEKAADAMKRMVGDKMNVVTWCGGGKVWDKTDWSPLDGKSCIIWPDADKQGVETGKAIANMLAKNKCKTVKIISVPDDKNGYDAADAEADGKTFDDFIKWAKAKAVEVTVQRVPPEPEPEPEQVMGPVDDEPEPPKPKKKDPFRDQPFRILGFNNGHYYYLPEGTQQVVSLSVAQHTSSNLLGLADYSYWQTNHGDEKKIHWDVAANRLLRLAEQQGIFDPYQYLRGRGAWRDGDQTIMHLGNKCWVDGKMISPKDIDSKHIYHAMTDVGIKLGQPLTNKQANKLFEFCSQLGWENELSAALLAGWCVIAPLSGILKWRPHIWITGPSGSGKSTVINDIIAATLGNTAIRMDGQATEAGIRQKLYQDARPIVFDEAEAEEKQDSIRMQQILNLARVSSSGGEVLKGGKDGKATSYAVRSCFCFSSINTSVKHFADESRISKLVLKIDHRESAREKYSILQDEIRSTLTDEFAMGLLSRSLKNIEALEENMRSFNIAATKVFQSRRIADQIGTLLAGTYSLFSTHAITPESAEEWLKKHEDWSDHTTIGDKPDPERLLDKICTHRTMVNTSAQLCKPTLGELMLCIAVDDYYLDHISEEQAQTELKRYGIKVEYDHVYISSNCDPIKGILRDTPWHSNWSRPLNELEGAERTNNMYFAPGIKSRATKIPVTLISD